MSFINDLKEKTLSVKTLVAIGIGAAVYVVLARFAAIPIPFIPNTYISTQYAFLAVMAMIFGPAAGTLIGFIGHTITDFTLGGPWWSWIIATTVCGLIMGLIMLRIDSESGEFGKKEVLLFNVGQVLAHAVAWILIAPTLDILIYAEPSQKVFSQGVAAWIVNAVTTGVIGTLLAFAYAKTRVKKGSLRQE